MIDFLNQQVSIILVIGLVFILLCISGIYFRLFLRLRKAQLDNDSVLATTKTDSHNIAFGYALEWLENSKKAIVHKRTLPANERNALASEITKRQQLVDSFEKQPSTEHVSTEQLKGTYHILGFNQNKEASRYSGYLHVTTTGTHRVNAEWIIDGEQTQLGTGFYHNNILVINFSYEGDARKIYKGVVVYRVINKNILNGFWSEKHGNDAYLGIEECRRLNKSETLFNTAQLN
ncbi:hypothetical protein [Maribacter sp. LLG6340-A2]|uniref:hypothetical protein n=1 Tax=Maribacter sp. LLG6340-A2 TaxID=3160834 RepID=UPI00386D5150